MNTGKRPRLTQAECDYLRELASSMSLCAAARSYGCSYSTIVALKRRGWVPAEQDKRPIPDDWADVAPGRSAEWLQKHYRTGRAATRRWLIEHPVRTRPAGPLPLPIPDGFPSDFGGEREADVAARYGVHRETARRWRVQQAEAQRIAEQRRLAALTPFERQLERVRNGSALVAKFKPRRVEPAFTLGGVSEMAA